jgi:anaerobic selenocysteine-containing dehydrogenase
MPGSRTARAVCSHDCPDTCAILVTIDEAGVATRVQGDPDHSVTRGFLCGKVAKYLDRVYSPSRLLYPMRRRAGAPKGRMPSGHEAEAFERISWDEALDIVTERLGHIAQEHGPESVLPYSYAGTMGVLGYGSMDRRFFHRLGAAITFTCGPSSKKHGTKAPGWWLSTHSSLVRHARPTGISRSSRARTRL